MPESDSEAAAAAERRKHTRVIAHFPVRSRPLDGSEMGSLLSNLGESAPKLPAVGLKMGRSGTWSMAATNLSIGGLSATGDLQVLGDRPLPKGTDLLVEIEFADGDEPLRAVAQVMWSAPVQNQDGKFLAGMMFVIISEHNLERIRKHVVKAVEEGKVVK